MPQRGGITAQGPLGESRGLSPLPDDEVHLCRGSVDEPPMEWIDGLLLGEREQRPGPVTIASACREHGSGEGEAHLSERERFGALAVTENRVGL